MFERYTEKTRRIIFFARYEVSQFGASAIETEHLLLGLSREDQALLSRFLPEQISNDSIRRRVEELTTIREKIATSIEIPFSSESHNVLKHTAEEADSLSSKHIKPEHLLLGLLREENSLAAKVLRESGVEYSVVRQQLESDAGK